MTCRNWLRISLNPSSSRYLRTKTLESCCTSEPFPDLFEPFPDLFEPFPDLFESFPDLFEPFPDLFEPFPDLFEPFPDLFEPFLDLLESSFRLWRPRGDIFRGLGFWENSLWLKFCYPYYVCRLAQTRDNVECARPKSSLAQMWQAWAVKITLFRLIYIRSYEYKPWLSWPNLLLSTVY